MKKMFPDYKNPIPSQKTLILVIIFVVIILFTFLFILNRKKLYEGVDILGVGSKEDPVTVKTTITPEPAPVITKPKDINQCNTVLDATNTLVISYQTAINDYEALQTAYDNYIMAIKHVHAPTTTPAPTFNNDETTLTNTTPSPMELLNEAQNVLQQAKATLTSDLTSLQEQKANLRTLQNSYNSSAAATK